MELSTEDITLVILGGLGLVAFENSRTSAEIATKVEKERKKREFKHGASIDPTLLRQKENILLKRGVALPPIPPNDPSQYGADLDHLLELSNGLTPLFGTADLLDHSLPTDMPNAGKKTATELFTRAGRFMGLTSPLVRDDDEANWAF